MLDSLVFRRIAGLVLLVPGLLAGADAPGAEIGNGQVRVKIFLPDGNSGFYRGTRFDWSGVVYSLQYKGHEYYGPWFQKTDPKILDWEYRGPDIVAGPCSGVTGPVDEFKPLGFDEAKTGGVFMKIGVGMLRKPEGGKYDSFRLFEIADPGKWTIRKNRDSVEFVHELSDPASGYGYVYRKVVRLSKGKPEMLLEHSLKNTGKRAIDTNVYNHNFLALDKQAAGPGYTITVPFQIRTLRPISPALAEARGNQIAYVKQMDGHDMVFTQLEGFGTSAKDHEIRIESRKAGAGLRITADRPLQSENLWSIRTVVAMEPFIAIAIEPGKEFTWTTTYDYYTLP